MMRLVIKGNSGKMKKSKRIIGKIRGVLSEKKRDI